MRVWLQRVQGLGRIELGWSELTWLHRMTTNSLCFGTTWQLTGISVRRVIIYSRLASFMRHCASRCVMWKVKIFDTAQFDVLFRAKG